MAWSNAPSVTVHRPLVTLAPLTAAAVSTATQLHAWRDLRNYGALRWIVINDDAAQVVQVTLDTSEDDAVSKAVDQEHQWIIQIQPLQQGSIPLGAGMNSIDLLHRYFRLVGQTVSLAAANIRWKLVGATRF